jgi:uncharacterized membrane protein YhaH (DUF805 family)
MGLGKAIGANLRGLTRFRGREPRGRFWPYAAAVILLAVATWTAVVGAVVRQALTAMERFAAAHPEQATVRQGPGGYAIEIRGHHPELMPDIGGVFVVMALLTAAVVALLAAAVARRLHDGGRSGAWGLMPLPFLGFGFLAARSMTAGGAPDLGLFALLFVNNVVYLGVLILLIVWLATPGDPHDNRFGPVVAP